MINLNFLSLKRKISFFIINNFLSGTKFFNIKRLLLNWSGYKIGKNTKIVGPLFITSELKVGDNTWIGKNLNCYGNGVVNIGSNCDIAPNVTFSTGGHLIGDESRRAGQGVNYNIVVSDCCWICVNSTLCKNITIGKSSVVAACSCVIDNVDSNVLVGGVPAKVIKKYE